MCSFKGLISWPGGLIFIQFSKLLHVLRWRCLAGRSNHFHVFMTLGLISRPWRHHYKDTSNVAVLPSSRPKWRQLQRWRHLPGPGPSHITWVRDESRDCCNRWHHPCRLVTKHRHHMQNLFWLGKAGTLPLICCSFAFSLSFRKLQQSKRCRKGQTIDLSACLQHQRAAKLTCKLWLASAGFRQNCNRSKAKCRAGCCAIF